MGWRFAWVSSNCNDFNRDYHVSFTKEEKASGKVYYNYEVEAFPSEEGPGISVFYKDKAGNIFHTYSAYARGAEMTMNTYNYLDYVPKGRDEDGLGFTMAWILHHDRYSDGKLADKDWICRTGRPPLHLRRNSAARTAAPGLADGWVFWGAAVLRPYGDWSKLHLRSVRTARPCGICAGLVEFLQGFGI